MELKSLIVVYNEVRSLRSNRTFMELKFGKNESVRIELYVLIVPLWN